MNQGPSFNTTIPGSSYPKLNGFYQRFMLTQDDPRMTPGKAEPHLPKETVKGTTKLKKATRVPKKIYCRDSIPKQQNTPIYGGFGSSKPNKASRNIVKNKKMPQLKKRNIK